MRQLQDLGHTVIFLIGDFTSLIGDPSGATAPPPLTAEQIRPTPRPTTSQASLVLDPENRDPLQQRMERPGLGAGLIQLASRYTVARMMERNDFHDRFTGWHADQRARVLYPLMQGYDSGAEATWNWAAPTRSSTCSMGRHLQQGIRAGAAVHPDHAAARRLDGVERCPRARTTTSGISEDANTMFAKVLSISDVLMWEWFTLLSVPQRGRDCRLSRPKGAGPQPQRTPRWPAGQGNHGPLSQCGGRRGGAGLHQPQQGRRA